MSGLKRSWFHLASGAGVGRVAGFLSNLALSRVLGPTDLGLFNLVTTTVQTGDTLVRVGSDFALNYELGGETDALKSTKGRRLTAAFSQQNLLITAILLSAMAVWLGPAQGLFPATVVEPQRRLWSTLLLLMVGLEAICAVPWEVLLVGDATRRLALRQGLFLPMRLLLAALGGAWGQITGAMLGWTLVAVIQPIWLAWSLRGIWPPPRERWRPDWSAWRQLMRHGLPFYGANLLSSLVFFPLLLILASRAGLADVGYLRIGQILQQLFGLLPGSLVPVLFLRLRKAESFEARMRQVERIFRLLWSLLLFVLLAYCLVDEVLIGLFFGSSFLPSIEPTRVMLMTSLLEVLLQILIQPLLSSGLMRRYALMINGGTLVAAVFGWLLVPRMGLNGFLIAKYLVAVLPLIPLLIAAGRHFENGRKLLPLLLLTILFTLYLFTGDLAPFNQDLERPILGIAMLGLAFIYRRDYNELLTTSIE